MERTVDFYAAAALAALEFADVDSTGAATVSSLADKFINMAVFDTFPACLPDGFVWIVDTVNVKFMGLYLLYDSEPVVVAVRDLSAAVSYFATGCHSAARVTATSRRMVFANVAETKPVYALDSSRKHVPVKEQIVAAFEMEAPHVVFFGSYPNPIENALKFLVNKAGFVHSSGNLPGVFAPKSAKF